MKQTLLFCLCFFFLIVSEAGQTQLKNVQVAPGNVVLQRFGAFTARDSPFGGIENASIDYDLSFRSNDTIKGGDLVIFHYEVKDRIGRGGYSLLEGRQYCCTADLVGSGACTQLNTLILVNISTNPDVNGNVLFYTKVNSTLDKTFYSNIAEKINLSKTGMWYIFAVNCDDHQIQINGTVTWKNPYGYLPGQILGYLPLHWVMSVGYLVMGITWMIACIMYRKDLMIIQHTISFVIAISIAENLLWAIDYTVYDLQGITFAVTNIIGSFLTATKLTSVRTLMLLVAIGFTITRPVLTRPYKVGISVLTLIYFLAEGTNRFMSVALSDGMDVNIYIIYFNMVMIVLANISFFIWIGIEMFFTIKKLQLGEKLEMYNRLSVLLIISVTLSFITVIAQFILETLDKTEYFFRLWWLFGGFWEFVYLICIFYVAWVWRPSARNSKFSYMGLEEGLLENGGSTELTDINEEKVQTKEEKFNVVSVGEES